MKKEVQSITYAVCSKLKIYKACNSISGEFQNIYVIIISQLQKHYKLKKNIYRSPLKYVQKHYNLSDVLEMIKNNC